MLNKKWLIRDLAIIPTLTHLLQKFVKFDSSTFDELFSVKLKIPDANVSSCCSNLVSICMFME